MASTLLELLSQQQPALHTRQALLVLGLQNDFVLPAGKLPVDARFVDRILAFVPRFRETAGDIVWVQSVFAAGRTVNDPSGDGDQVFAESLDLLGPSDDDSDDDRDYDRELVSPRTKKPSVSARHTRRALAMLRNMRRRRGNQPTPDLDDDDEDDEDGEDEELFLSSLSRNGPCCVSGTSGAALADVARRCVDEGSDTFVQTSHYSAFNSTSLLLQLRSKLVTHLYICGCLTNINVHATALDAARHGITINLIEDCLGYRNQWRHDEALRQMHELMGAQIVTTQDLINDLSQNPEEQTAAEQEALEGLGNLKISNSTAGPNAETASIDKESGSKKSSKSVSKRKSRKTRGQSPAPAPAPTAAAAVPAPGNRGNERNEERRHHKDEAPPSDEPSRPILRHQKSQTLRRSNSKQGLVKSKIRMRSRSEKEDAPPAIQAPATPSKKHPETSAPSAHESTATKTPVSQPPSHPVRDESSRPSTTKQSDRRQKSADVSASPSYVQRLRNSLSQASLSASRSKHSAANSESSPSRADKKSSSDHKPPLPRPTSLPGFKSRNSVTNTSSEPSPTKGSYADVKSSHSLDKDRMPQSPTLLLSGSRSKHKKSSEPQPAPVAHRLSTEQKPPSTPPKSERKKSTSHKVLEQSPPDRPAPAPPPPTAAAIATATATAAPSSPPAPQRAPPQPPLSSSSGTMAPSGKKAQSLATFPTLGPKDKIAEGDSRIIYDFFPADMPQKHGSTSLLKDEIFTLLYNEVKWQKMYHAQGEVPRLVCVQGEFGEDGSMPVYRHPSDQSMSLMHFSPTIQRVREQVEKLVKHPVNHVLIQLYRSGNDYISEHSDKTLDIVRGTSIVNVSFGAQRTMRLRTKKSAAASKSDNDDDTTATAERLTQRVVMPHNSMFVLGQDSNMRWLHGIMADKRMPEDRSNAEKAYSGMRISLTFRYIGTFLDSESRLIWGQGAIGKDRASANEVINGEEEETEVMIRAFGTENQSTEFDWVDVYGNGFDVLHFRAPPRDDPVFFASNHTIESRQIALCLAELRLSHTVIEPPTFSRDYERDRQVCFRDTDAYHTEVTGVLPILFYLDRYRRLDRDDERGKAVTATAYDLLFLMKELQIRWTAKKTKSTDGSNSESDSSFLGLLHDLEERQNRHGGAFAAGSRFSIADCALWPLLDNIVDHWKGWSRSQYPSLTTYYESLHKSRRAVTRLRKEPLRKI